MENIASELERISSVVSELAVSLKDHGSLSIARELDAIVLQLMNVEASLRSKGLSRLVDKVAESNSSVSEAARCVFRPDTRAFAVECLEGASSGLNGVASDLKALQEENALPTNPREKLRVLRNATPQEASAGPKTGGKKGPKITS